LAAQQHWTLITHNGVDFRMLQRAWLFWQVPRLHDGILVLEQVPTGLAAQMAQEIDRLVRSGPQLLNAVHAWQSATGWQPYRA
jgi:hypothetical protein